MIGSSVSTIAETMVIPARSPCTRAGAFTGRRASSSFCPLLTRGVSGVYFGAEDFVVKYKEKGRDAVAVGRVALGNNRLYLLAVTGVTADVGNVAETRDQLGRGPALGPQQHREGRQLDDTNPALP